MLSKKQNILLDTDIVSHQLKPDYRSQVAQLLFDQRKNGYGMAISDYTHYEILRSAKKSVADKARQIIGGIYAYAITREVLLFAAELYGYYKASSGEIISAISDGDIIIASTAIITDSLLLTGNRIHFPPPFFKEEARWRADKKQGVKMKSKYFYLLSADKKAIEAAQQGNIIS